MPTIEVPYVVGQTAAYLLNMVTKTDACPCCKQDIRRVKWQAFEGEVGGLVLWESGLRKVAFGRETSSFPRFMDAADVFPTLSDAQVEADRRNAKAAHIAPITDGC